MKEYGMYQGYNVEGTGSPEVNVYNQEIDINTPSYGTCMPGCVMPEVVECPQERCIHRTINYTVPHIMPVHTKIINHHIYKHVYSPTYSCNEENVVINENCGCGCGRMY